MALFDVVHNASTAVNDAFNFGLDYVLFGNKTKAWLTALAISLITWILSRLIRHRLTKHLLAFAKKTDTLLDDLFVSLIAKTHSFFYITVALFLGSHALDITPKLEQIIQRTTIVVLIVQAALWGNSALTFWVTHVLRKKAAEDGQLTTTFLALGFLGRLLLWTIGILLALDNLGFNVSTLVTGLGIGGVAVALAVQNVLGDLLASLSIILDKPFVVGDFIIVESLMGNVEHIGLKTTRLRSLSGEQIIFSNNDLLKSRIRNFKHMFERRVVFSISVDYNTAIEKIEKLSQLLRNIVTANNKVRLDRAHFRELSVSSLIFEVVYFVLDPDYKLYMDIQEAINIEIIKHLRNEGIDFALPTQSIILQEPKTASR